jgi:hypothetical protein
MKGHVYDETTASYRPIGVMYVYDETASPARWREVLEAWVYDSNTASWRQYFVGIRTPASVTLVDVSDDFPGINNHTDASWDNVLGEPGEINYYLDDVLVDTVAFGSGGNADSYDWGPVAGQAGRVEVRFTDGTNWGFPRGSDPVVFT